METNYNNCIFRRKDKGVCHMFFTINSVKNLYDEGCWGNDEQSIEEFIGNYFDCYPLPESIKADEIAGKYNTLSVIADDVVDSLPITRDLRDDIQENGVVTLTIDFSKLKRHSWSNSLTITVPMPKPKHMMSIIKKLIGVR